MSILPFPYTERTRASEMIQKAVQHLVNNNCSIVACENGLAIFIWVIEVDTQSMNQFNVESGGGSALLIIPRIHYHPPDPPLELSPEESPIKNLDALIDKA